MESAATFLQNQLEEAVYSDEDLHSMALQGSYHFFIFWQGRN